MNESWQKGYEILKQANEKADKFRNEAAELLKEPTLTKENYQKVKSLLEKEAQIRNEALEKIEKIHRDETENLEQQWSKGESN